MRKLLLKAGFAGGILLFLFFVLFPFIQMLSTSLKRPDELFTIPPRWIPENISLESFAAALKYKQFIGYFMNTVFVSLSTCLIVIVVSVLATYGFTRLEFPGRRFLLTIILFSQMFCISAIIIPLYRMMAHLGLLNSFAGLIIAYLTFTVPVAIWLLRGFLLHIPVDMEEAAMIDGASKIRAFFSVVLPLLRPGIGATAVYVIFLTWQEFLFALVFLTDPGLRTLPVGIMDFRGQYETNWGTMMAAAALISLPVFLLFTVIQRELVAGLTEGATKG